MATSSHSPTSPAAAYGAVSGRRRRLRRPSISARDNTINTMVADQISQSVISTSNLLHRMLQSSPSQAHLINLPNNLLAKASTIRHTEQVLEQLPRVISHVDAYMDNGLRSFHSMFLSYWVALGFYVFNPSVHHLETVSQLLRNIEICQLTDAQLLKEVNFVTIAKSYKFAGAYKSIEILRFKHDATSHLKKGPV